MNDDLLINRLRIGQLSAEIRKGRNTKLLVFRNDRSGTPHLLISFGNASKEIDIHITRRVAGGLEDYLTVAKIPESAIAAVFESLAWRSQEVALQLLRKSRPVRPGWLARKGYLISYPDADAERMMIDLFAPKRKHKRKWERVLEAAGLENYLLSGLPGQTIFRPSILHKLKSLDYRPTVLACRVHRKHKPALAGLYLGLTNSGKRKWFLFDGIPESLMPLGKSLIDQLQGLIPEDKWKLLWDELHLEEIDWIASCSQE